MDQRQGRREMRAWWRFLAPSQAGLGSLYILFLSIILFSLQSVHTLQMSQSQTQDLSLNLSNDYYEDPEEDSIRLIYRDDDEYNGVYEVNGPCSDYKPGEDDLQAFDFIRKFRLDVLVDGEMKSVSRVRGSDRLQTAYRIDRGVDLTRDTREVFPMGLPDYFSFLCTWRTRKPPRVSWHLMSMTDVQNRTQFSVTLNPATETIEFSIVDYESRLQTLEFRAVDVFDKNWHKLHFGVFRDKVVLFADCEEVGYELLRPKGFIDVNGRISIAKIERMSHITVPIDLQWMTINCDPNRPQRETCNELPPKPAKIEKPRCDVICPMGPMGFNGTDGYPGERGLTGLPGVPGPPGSPGRDGLPGLPSPPQIGHKGFKGDAGARGLDGMPGLPGPIGPIGPVGVKGEKGEPGETIYLPSPRGSHGVPGLPGQKGHQGLPGPAGMHGAQGLPGGIGPSGPPGRPGIGQPGSPGKTYSEDELREICASVLRDQLAELTAKLQGMPGIPGAPGLRGRPGADGIAGPPDRLEELTKGLRGPIGLPGVSKPGRRGPQGLEGIQGDRGSPGEPGERGFTGHPGLPGLRGPEGAKGERGDQGERGPEGIGLEGLQGPVGPPGPAGPPGVGIRGPEGLPGSPGIKGHPGLRGMPGVPGPPGYCEFCNYPWSGPLPDGGKKGPSNKR